MLGEKTGKKRRLPIIIGGFEAQAIAIELESMTPSRPLTHDLFKTFADAYFIEVKEVVIYNLIEGIFYAKLISEKEGQEIEIDTRTSDAIALAVRFKCPIYTYESILASAGIILEEKSSIEKEIDTAEEGLESHGVPVLNYEKLTLEALNEKLQNAIDTENYEEASKIKEEIDNRNIN